MKAMTDPLPRPLFFEPVHSSRWPKQPWIILPLLILMALVLSGCGKPPMLVHQYILEYPAPVIANTTKLNQALKVEQFSVAQAFNSNAMVYQPQPFKSESYNYSRWRVNPGYLVTDYLLRDFREARLFDVVFGPKSTGKYRYLLEGGVEDFQELDEPDGWKAALGLTVTVLDNSKEELPQRVVFQKNYRAVEPMPEKTPDGLARAMSRAMEHLSVQIMADTYEAVLRRSATK
jgi:ABC-type uncharacterized transport system auxiliary subunit